MISGRFDSADTAVELYSLPNGCAPPTPTRRCIARMARRGRCRTYRCSMNSSTCWAAKSRRRRRRAGAAAETAYAAGVLDTMISREDLMDDEDHLIAQDLLYAEDLADRFIERDHRELAERAAADRDWTYRHLVVDEAQELSEMDWRVLMRRCPSRSFTVVGDLAQRRSVAGAQVMGHDAGAVCARPLGVPVSVGQLPHPGGDHDGRRRAARRVRTGDPPAGVGPRLRGAAVVPSGHRGRTTHCDRGIRPATRAVEKVPAW